MWTVHYTFTESPRNSQKIVGKENRELLLNYKYEIPYFGVSCPPWIQMSPVPPVQTSKGGALSLGRALNILI